MFLLRFLVSAVVLSVLTVFRFHIPFLLPFLWRGGGLLPVGGIEHSQSRPPRRRIPCHADVVEDPARRAAAPATKTGLPCYRTSVACFLRSIATKAPRAIPQTVASPTVARMVVFLVTGRYSDQNSIPRPETRTSTTTSLLFCNGETDSLSWRVY